ncbi:MAG: hypothetical protein AAFY75_04125 [Pseudomonadota bacterium]
MERWQQEKIAVQCLQEMERLGVQLEVVKDFRSIPAVMSQLGRPLSSPSDPSKVLMTEANSFWIVGRRVDEKTGQNKPVIGCAVRVDDLGCEDVESFISRSVEVLFGVNVLSVNSNAFSGRTWGRAAYIGALTSGVSLGMGRDAKKIIQLLMTYTHFRAVTDLRADVNYCFLRQRDEAKAVTYGFLSAEQFVWQTSKQMYSDGNPGWLVSTSASQVPSLMVRASRLLSQPFSENKQGEFSVEIADPAGGNDQR